MMLTSLLLAPSLLLVPQGVEDSDRVAHWTFDGSAETRCDDATGTAPPARFADGSRIPRVPGVLGRALGLRGVHRLACPGGPDFATLRQVTLSAWVLPTRFDRYNEIFRKEDGSRRVLFSFQEFGRVLSLGLNIGGYLECDAPVDPAKLRDGHWHHCAATFDGRTMRVYLDGTEIHAVARPGVLRAGGAAPGCIGSLNGGECFQGAIDDLRIYRRACSATEVATLARRDAEQLAAASRATVAALRRLPSGPQLTLAQQVDALCEYLPLTDQQWQGLTPADRARWQQVVAIRRDFQALQAGAVQAPATRAAAVAALTARIAALDLIHPRPRQREAVAPRVPRPTTPVTRSLTAAEAQAAVERDWLHQADGQPTLARVRDELRWARALARRLGGMADGAADGTAGDTVDATAAALAAVEAAVAAGTASARELYLQVRRIKRSLMFRNPVLDFDRLLFVDMPYPAGSEWRHETRHRLGYMAVPGARLLLLQGLSPAGALRQLMPQAPLHGAFWRPDVSFDGERVLFCFQPHNEKSFHVYEIGVDGQGLRQITYGPYDDLDPIYLPDGRHILFSSTRGHTYVRCMPPTSAFVLTRCDLDGGDMYIVSRNNEPDYLPSVLDDGRIVYTRWEYTDKPLWRAQGLWTMQPDGTAVNTLWGNQSVWPDLLKDARSIPGSQRIMFTGSAHHNWFAGSVGILDPNRGMNFPDGITKVTADVAWPESGNGPTDPVESAAYHRSGRYAGYYSPYPLSERDFLVSAERAGTFVLYLMDVDGNRELVYEGRHHILHAMPVRTRRRPPVLPDTVAWPTAAERDRPQPGVIFSDDVYEGVPKALKDRATFLRVLSIDAKTYTYWDRRPYLSTGPVVSGVQSEGVKRILGTVPIEKDGSVAFYAPPGIPLHFQLLDDRYRALQTMRSFTGVMPGERRGCFGCHERHHTAPANRRRSLAAVREPSTIQPPPWGEDTVSWARYVRPVLDRYCRDCHQGDSAGGKVLDLTPRPGHLGWDDTYWLFTGRPTWGRPYRAPADPPPGFGIAGMLMVEGYDQRDPKAYRTPPPLTRLSYRSRLVELAASGTHHDVKVDEVSRRRLVAWVDAMCPYRGDAEVRALPDPEFPGVEWLSVRPRIRTAPRIQRPGPLRNR